MRVLLAERDVLHALRDDRATLEELTAAGMLPAWRDPAVGERWYSTIDVERALALVLAERRQALRRQQRRAR